MIASSGFYSVEQADEKLLTQIPSSSTQVIVQILNGTGLASHVI